MILLLLACAANDSGTVVGNPGDAMARVAPPSAELTLTQALVEVEALSLVGCPGTASEGQSAPAELEEDELDLLGEAVPLVLPAGTWCSLVLAVEDELFVAGTGPDESSFQALLAPGTVSLDSTGGVDVDGQDFVFELAEPGWLSADLLELSAGAEVQVDAGHALFDELSDAVALRSALFADADADGQVGEGERDAGALAAGEAREQDLGGGAGSGDTGEDLDDDDDDDDRGCGGGQAWLLLPLLGLRRRYRCSAPCPSPDTGSSVG